MIEIRIMRIKQNESALYGKWIFDGKKMLEDETAKRIQYLISNVLEDKAVADNGWEILYQDPIDKRFWELTYLQSELHGGGPPSLINISEKQSKDKYIFY